jgi:hypothetical protein
MSNISPRQFGSTTRPIPMPSTIGSFGSGSSGMRPAPMVTPKLGGSMGTKPVRMPSTVGRFGR